MKIILFALITCCDMAFAQAQLDPTIIMSGKPPVYESHAEAQKRAAQVRQLQLQNELAEQQLRLNALKLQQEQAALKAKTQSASMADLAQLEERLGKLETALKALIDIEEARWAGFNEFVVQLSKEAARSGAGAK